MLSSTFRSVKIFRGWCPSKPLKRLNFNLFSLEGPLPIHIVIAFISERCVLGKYKTKAGYVRVFKSDHPRAYKGQVSEHVIVMENYLGRPLPKGTVVHHINRIRSDNRVENLLLLRNEDDHRALHRAMRSGNTDVVRAFEDWSREFMANLTAGLPEKECFSGSLAITPENNLEQNKFVIRRNKRSLKPFIEFDEEVLISPEGRIIEYEESLFGEQEEIGEGELTKKQLHVYANKLADLELSIKGHEKNTRIQELLFQKLRKLRLKIAKKKALPPYMIFKDSTLREIAEKMPTSKPELLKIEGVGEKKLEWYGSIFLSTIKEFRSEYNLFD